MQRHEYSSIILDHFVPQADLLSPLSQISLLCEQSLTLMVQYIDGKMAAIPPGCSSARQGGLLLRRQAGLQRPARC